MHTELRDFGLSDNEITIYTTLLKTGITTVNRIAAISGVKRSTAYDTVHSLISKGIVSSSLNGTVHHFEAAQPSKLIHLLDEKKKRISQIVPDLENLQNIKKSRSGVTYYEGKKGVMTVLNDILDNGVSHLTFIGSRKMAKLPLKHYPDNFMVKRVEQNIFVDGILANEDKDDDFYKKAEKLSSFTYTDKLDGSEADIFIYGDKVSFITTTADPVGVIIDNKEITQQIRRLYEWLKK